MPDNDDLRMNQNETLNCKLALMGVWTEACREAAAFFGVNPDGSGNFSSVTQAQAGSTAGTLAVDGISADEMTSRLAASLVEHFPDKTDIITGDPAAAKAYVKQYVVDLANHQALAQARTNSKLFHKQLNRAAVGLADEHGPYAPVPAAEEEFDMCVPLMDGTIEENSEEVAEFSRELDRRRIREGADLPRVHVPRHQGSPGRMHPRGPEHLGARTGVRRQGEVRAVRAVRRGAGHLGRRARRRRAHGQGL